jgi:hypothetical protein
VQDCILHVIICMEDNHYGLSARLHTNNLDAGKQPHDLSDSLHPSAKSLPTTVLVKRAGSLCGVLRVRNLDVCKIIDN